MSHIVLYALLATLFTYFMTALGSAVVVFFKNPNQKIMNVMLGFAAGVMIAASFWSLLAPAIEKLEQTAVSPVLVVVPAFCFGAVFIWISDKVVNISRKKANSFSDAQKTSSRIFMLVLSITIHNIPEGLAVGVAFGALGTGYTKEALYGAVLIAFGIALQNFPEGAAVSLPVRREGHSRWKSFFIGQMSAIVEPIFGVIGAITVLYMEKLLPFTLSFAAGAMILVSVHELIPECQMNKDAHPYFATFGIVAGFALMMLLDVALS